MKILKHLFLISILSTVALIFMIGPAIGGDQGLDPGMFESDDSGQRDHDGMSSGRKTEKPLEKEEAKNLLQDMLESGRNPDLKVGRIEDREAFYEAEIITKDSESLVDRVTVNKTTGRVRPAY